MKANRSEDKSKDKCPDPKAGVVLTKYDCKVEYIDVEGCGFDLSTSIVPRFPYADFDYEWKPENCDNKVIFKSKSCVRTKVAGEFVAIETKR